MADEVLIKMYGHIDFIITRTFTEKRKRNNKRISMDICMEVNRGLDPDFYDEEYHFEVCPEVIGYNPAKLGNF